MIKEGFAIHWLEVFQKSSYSISSGLFSWLYLSTSKNHSNQQLNINEPISTSSSLRMLTLDVIVFDVSHSQKTKSMSSSCSIKLVSSSKTVKNCKGIYHTLIRIQGILWFLQTFISHLFSSRCLFSLLSFLLLSSDICLVPMVFACSKISSWDYMTHF